MPSNKITEQLQQNLQLIYRQAIDADARLDELQRAGQGKFKTIFKQQEGFSCSSNRFSPYVEELAYSIKHLSLEDESHQKDLAEIVIKLQLLLQTLQVFLKKTR